jgi:hypothetical protein
MTYDHGRAPRERVPIVRVAKETAATRSPSPHRVIVSVTRRWRRCRFDQIDHIVGPSSRIAIGLRSVQAMELSFLPPVLPMPGAQRRVPVRLKEASMHGLIYLIGLIVVIMFILSLLGLR